MKLFFTYIFFISFFFKHFDVLSQKNSEFLKVISKSDSAMYAVAAMPDDSLKVNAINKLCEEFNAIGRFQYTKRLATNAISISDRLNYRSGKIISLNNLGQSLFRTGSYAEALKVYFDALKLSEEVNNIEEMANCYNNISNVYVKKKEFSNALKYQERTRNIYEKKGLKKRLAISLDNLGVIYEEQGMYEEAFKNHLMSLRIKEELRDTTGIGWSYYNITVLFASQGIYDKAQKYCLECIKIKIANGDLPGLGGAYGNLGHIYLAQKKIDKALESCLKGLEISKRINFKESVMEIENILSEIYGIKGDFKRALFHFKAYSVIRDSLNNNEVSKKILETELNYRFNKQIADERLKAKLEKTITSEKLNRQKTVTIFLSAIIILITVLGAIIIIVSRRKLKIAAIVEQQKKELALQEANMKGQEKERRRLAIELHDGLGGNLSAIKINVQGLVWRKQQNDKDLEKILKDISNACSEVRNISHNLAPPEFEDGLFTEILSSMVFGFSGNGKLKINFDCFPEEAINRLDQNVKTTLYRIIQELLNNVIKHAEASEADVSIYSEQELHILVQDNGKGMSEDKNRIGIGLRNIEARVNALNGSLIIDSKPGKGTAVHIHINA